MASPQLENGFTRISNELLEALSRVRVPGEAMQVFLVIIRKTYGFQKKQDRIALSQFQLATGIVKPSISRALKILDSMRLIIISKNAKGSATTFRINKDYSAWRPLAKKLFVSNFAKSISKDANESLAKTLHTKDNKKNNTKENISRERKSTESQIIAEAALSKALDSFGESRNAVEQFIALIAEKHKTGTVSGTRKLSVIESLNQLQKATREPIFLEALNNVISRDIGNVSYLKKVIDSIEEKGAQKHGAKQCISSEGGGRFTPAGGIRPSDDEYQNVRKRVLQT